MLLHELRESARPILATMRGTLPQMLYSRWYHSISEGTRICPDRRPTGPRKRAVPGFESGWRVAALRPDAGPGAIVAERSGEQRLRSYATQYVPDRRASSCVWRPGDDVLVNARIDELNARFLASLVARVAQGTANAPRSACTFQVAVGSETAFVTRLWQLSRRSPPGWNMKILAGTHHWVALTPPSSTSIGRGHSSALACACHRRSDAIVE